MPTAPSTDASRAFTIASQGPAHLRKVIAGLAECGNAEIYAARAAEQFVGVRAYVDLALSLPADKNGIRARLGEGLAGDGLGVNDFHRTFSRVHEHAGRWRLLEHSIRKVRVKLERFSAQMEHQSQRLELLIADMQRSQAAGRTSAPRPAAPRDELMAIFTLMGERVGALVDYCACLKAELDDFRIELKSVILQELQLRLIRAEAALDGRRAADLDARIQAAQRKADAARDSFNALEAQGWVAVADAMGSVGLQPFWDPISPVVSQLKNSQAEIAKEIAGFVAMRETLPKLHLLVQNVAALEGTLLGADIGLSRLLDIWNASLTWGRSSTGALEAELDIEHLIVLSMQLKEVTDPWVEIGWLMKK